MHENSDDSSSDDNLPLRLEPMILTHLALTGDVTQHREWRDRVEGIIQRRTVELTQDPEARRLLSRWNVWQRIRTTGKVGAMTGVAISGFWMAWLLPTYAVGHGFGWLAALTYMLPFPIAWKVARSLWQKAALGGMRDVGYAPSLVKRATVLPRSAIRAAIAGFGFGFTLVFLQGLISWFMTPMPTIAGELFWDAIVGVYGGAISGAASMVLAPLLSRSPPK